MSAASNPALSRPPDPRRPGPGWATRNHAAAGADRGRHGDRQRRRRGRRGRLRRMAGHGDRGAGALACSVARALARSALGVDLITPMAIVGALALGEELTAAVIALMLSGGDALERYAARRSRRELTALLARAPHSARLRTADGLVEVAVERVAPATCCSSARARCSRWTASSRARTRCWTSRRSPASRCRAPSRAGTRSAVAPPTPGTPSTCARRAPPPRAPTPPSSASSRRPARGAPFVRMADRYAVIFLAVTLALAGTAWAASGDPVRALAVLVVATPCP